jgi:tRNA(fMet)-specific endonuclease VapC
MTQFILDTDHVALILRGDDRLQKRTEQESSLFITVVTFQEVFNGWTTRINQAKPDENFVALYARLWDAIAYFQKTEILNFDAKADATFRSLLQNNPPLRKARLQRDMRIAAIALIQDMTLVTRNYRDFSQVPGLMITDWSIEL